MNIFELSLSGSLGGLELHMAKLSRWLIQNNEHCLVCVRPSTPLAKYFNAEAIPVVLASVKFKIFPILAAWRLAKLVDQKKIDCLHIHCKKDLPLAVLVKKFSRQKLMLVHSRHMDLPHNKHDAYHRFLYGNIDKLIVVTKKLRDQVLERLPIDKNKIFHCYLGVASPTYDSHTCDLFRKSLQLLKDDFVVGIVGTIQPAKGQDVVIEACRILTNQNINIKVLVVGHTINASYLEKLKSMIVDFGLTQNIYFTGFNADPQSIMSCLDVLVLATKEETFGLVLIEAMMMGTTVIGTNSGGVPEIIEHEKTGLLVEPLDANDLADAIKCLKNDFAFSQDLANNGMIKAKREFSEDIQFERLRNIIFSS